MGFQALVKHLFVNGVCKIPGVGGWGLCSSAVLSGKVVPGLSVISMSGGHEGWGQLHSSTLSRDFS